MKTLLGTLLLGLGTLASVSPAQVPQRLPPAVTSDADANVVTVQNQRTVPVTVYLEHGQFDRRLGVVPAFHTAALPLPGWAVEGHARIKLFAHPDGNTRDLSSQEFTLSAPARLGMVIPPHGGLAPTPPDTMMETLGTEQLAGATLTVDNPRDVPVTVYARHGPFDVRLGQVAAHARTTMRFPKSAVAAGGSLTIFVRPDGASDLESETLQVRGPQHLGLRVPR